MPIAMDSMRDGNDLHSPVVSNEASEPLFQGIFYNAEYVYSKVHADKSLVSCDDNGLSLFCSIGNVKWKPSPAKHHRGGYNTPERNIFVKMQQMDPIQSTQIPIYKKPPPPDTLRLSAEDQVWFEYSYHLSRIWDTISIPRFVPGFLHRMYGLSLNHYALRQSLMGQASGYFAIMNQQPLSQSRRFLADLLPDVQRAISTLTFDEVHLCAVFQLVKIYTQLGDSMGAHRHMQGLRLMVEYLLAKYEEPPPLVMCVWRAALYFDNSFAFEGIPFAFPTPEKTPDEVHRKWLSDFIPYSQRQLIDYPLAQFELDDIEHRVMTLIQYRQSSTFNPETDQPTIEAASAEIQRGLKEWLKRPVLVKCKREELKARERMDLSHAAEAQFLHYPPLMFENENYALLLISYHSIFILTTLLTKPEIGPDSDGRFDSAIMLCRLLAFWFWKSKMPGRPGCIHWHAPDLLRAGLVLGETSYPLEFNWIIERLREKKFKYAQQMADSLIAAWRMGETVMTVFGNIRRSASYIEMENISDNGMEKSDE